MIDVSLKHIKKSYGAVSVLHDVNMDIQEKDRIGLIGQNGSGKTTVLKIIAGREEYDNGTLTVNKDKKTGYLDQIPVYADEYTVSDVLSSAFLPLIQLKDEMRKLEKIFAKGFEAGSDETTAKQMQTYGKLQTEFERMGGFEYEVHLERICMGLKLSADFLDRRFNLLSSGEKSIVVLGKILLESCDILLLDEPTNHLDFDAIEWLEAFLKEYPGCVVIISHDRYFLDRSVNKIVDLEAGRTEAYHGNYSYYIEEKERRLFAQFEQYKNQEKKIKAMEAAVKRFREWGRRSDNPDMFKKAAHMEKRIEKMEKIDRPILERKKIRPASSAGKRSGKSVVEIKNLSKQFNGNILFQSINELIRYRERVALLGKNGSGKSTIIKIILGKIPPDRGTIHIGSQVNVGYLAQEVSFPVQERTALDEVRYVLEMEQGEARKYMAKFLFFRDDVFKKIFSLSGGELVRLKLCLLLYQDINFLVLDEPTNHLDIDSREVFEEYLQEFTGTILFVSHDRYFINKMADRILLLENDTWTNYPGNYDDLKDIQSRMQPAKKNVQPEKDTKQSNIRQDQKQQRGRENRRKIIEADMEEIENKILLLEADMVKFPSDYEKQQVLYIEKETLKGELEKLFDELIELE